MEEGVEIARELTVGLLERTGVRAEVNGFSAEGDIYLEIRGDREGILIGKHGHTLESLQLLINRMVNKRLKEPVRVILDIDDYRKRRAETLKKMAVQLGEKAKRLSHAMTIGPFNAHDRRIIHITLKEDPFLRTESFGEGSLKRISIIPKAKEGGE